MKLLVNQAVTAKHGGLAYTRGDWGARMYEGLRSHTNEGARAQLQRQLKSQLCFFNAVKIQAATVKVTHTVGRNSCNGELEGVAC